MSSFGNQNKPVFDSGITDYEKSSVLFPEYSRISKENLAKIKRFRNRKRVLDLFLSISCNPGISYRKVAKVCKMGNGVLSYYLDNMEKLELIRIKRKGNRMFLFERDLPYEDHKICIHLQNETEHRVLQYLTSRETGAYFFQIKHAIGKSSPTTSIVLGKLSKAGLICRIPGIHTEFCICNQDSMHRILTYLSSKEQTKLQVLQN